MCSYCLRQARDQTTGEPVADGERAAWRPVSGGGAPAVSDAARPVGFGSGGAAAAAVSAATAACAAVVTAAAGNVAVAVVH